MFKILYFYPIRFTTTCEKYIARNCGTILFFLFPFSFFPFLIIFRSENDEITERLNFFKNVSTKVYLPVSENTQKTASLSIFRSFFDKAPPFLFLTFFKKVFSKKMYAVDYEACHCWSSHHFGNFP